MASARDGSGGTEPSGHCRVLIVDSDPIAADLVAAFLEHVDEEIDAVFETDTRTALERIEREPFDCVVTEYALFGMDGIDMVTSTACDPPGVLYTHCRDVQAVTRARENEITYVRKRTASDQYEALASRIRERASG